MEMNEDYITQLSELKFEDFDKELEGMLSNKSNEEKLAILHLVKTELKDIKSDLVAIKRIATDYEEKVFLKSRIKKIKEKITILNYKTRLVNSTKEKQSKRGILNGKQRRLKNDIFNQEDISEYDIKDQVITLDYLIFEDFTEDNYEVISKYAHEISNNLANYFTTEEGFKEFFILLSDLKNRVNCSVKDSSERAALKSIVNDFKNVYKLYKNRVAEDNKKNMETSSYYEIVNYLLSSEENYNYLKKLVEKEDRAVNARYNNRHIVFYILECYIHNFKRMVNDKKSDYINLDYIEEVYYLFTKSPFLRFTKEERELIDLRIKEFEQYIDKTLIKQKRKNYAKSICKKMKSDKFFNDTSYYEFPLYNDDELGYFQVSLTNNIEAHVNREPYLNEAYINDGIVYNVSTKDDGKIALNIYAISYYNFIVKDCEVDKYLERCEMLHEEVDEFFKKELVFKVNGEYPVINYELEFYPSGKLCDIKVKEDTIVVKPINSEKYQELENLYKKSIIKNDDPMSELNEHFEKMLQSAYLGFIKEHKLPYLYYGKTMPEQTEIDKIINDLSSDLYDMDKHDYAKIIDIISNESDVYHYSHSPIKNAVYEMKLLDPVSYLGIENQRMLADLYFNRRKFSNKERLNSLKIAYRYKYYKQSQELNSNIGYVDTNAIKQKRGRIKVRFR